MVGKIIFQIRGAKEMENLLKQLGPRVAQRVGNNALRAAAKPIVDEAKRLAPRRKRGKVGKLQRLIRSELVGSVARNTLEIVIGVARPRGSIAHLLEFGHVGKNQYGVWGYVRAYPFLRPAMDTRAHQALWIMGRVLASGIDAQVRALDKGRK